MSVSYIPWVPSDLTEGHNLLLHYKVSGGHGQRNRTFLQNAEVVLAGTDGITHERITCNSSCQQKGHYAKQRPDGATTTTTQNDKRYNDIPSTHSTLQCSGTPHSCQISGAERTTTSRFVQMAARTQVSSLIGDIKNFGSVWYNPKSPANIFSMAKVSKRCRS